MAGTVIGIRKTVAQPRSPSGIEAALAESEVFGNH